MSALSACWRGEEAQAIFVTEALEGNDAIFLATHTPIEGFDVAGRDAGQFAHATERAVLDALANPDREHAFCVVQGEPGSGKSHLIRWLSVNWPHASDIKLLLRRADGSLEGALGQLRARLPEEFAPLFENLGQRQKATEQGRAKIFMSTVGVTLEPDHFDTPHPDNEWCRQYAPADLLAHPTIRQKWDAPARILRLLEGAGGERNSASASFNLFDMQELGELCAPLRGHPSIVHARAIASKLEREADAIRSYRNQEWLADELADEHGEEFPASMALANALNLRRNDAIQNVLGVSAQGLKLLFRQVREALAERGQRLVLLLEDITSWEGLDDSLIDVLVFNAAARGDDDAKPVCPLISVVGLTPAYYDRLQGNYTQRITHEIRLGQATDGLQDVATMREPEKRRQFAARYLSAVRSGTSELEKWLPEVRQLPGTPAPNPCEFCPRQEECFATFGEEGGIGLFPFTPHAFDRFFDALKDNDNGQTWKTPRGVLQAILNPNLQQPETLAAGTYPTALIEPEAFRTDRRSTRALSLPVERIVENRIADEDERMRMRRVLSYWGTPDRAGTTMVDGELAFAGARQSLFEAFDLPWLGAEEAGPDIPAPASSPPAQGIEGGPTVAVEGASPTEIAPSTPVPKPVEAKPIVPAKPKRIRASTTEMEALFEQIRNWTDTRTMQAGQKWNAIAHELIARLDARAFGVPRPLFERLLTPEMVKLEGTTPRPLDYFTLPADLWVRAGLEAYLTLKFEKSVLSEDAAFHRRNLASFMRRLEREVAAYIDRRIPRLEDGEKWSPVASFAQILLGRAFLRGAARYDAALADHIRTILSDEGDAEGDFSARCGPWQDWLNATKSMHDRLRGELRAMISLSLSEGGRTGGASLIDSSELAGAVKRLVETGQFDAVPLGGTGLQEPYKRACELAAHWNDKRSLIDRTELSQVKARTETVAELLRNKTVDGHIARLDACITAIADQLGFAAPDKVRDWKSGLVKAKLRLDDGAGERVEKLIMAIEEGEVPGRLLPRLDWLAQAPARDLAEIWTLAQQGERTVEALRDHARDCIREASGSGSLSDVHDAGHRIVTAVTQALAEGDAA